MLNKRRVCKNQPCFDGYPMISNCQKVNPRKRCLLAESLLLGGDWNMAGFWLSIYWECHHPNWVWLIFFRGVGIPPTSLFCWGKISNFVDVKSNFDINLHQQHTAHRVRRATAAETVRAKWKNLKIVINPFTGLYMPIMFGIPDGLWYVWLYDNPVIHFILGIQPIVWEIMLNYGFTRICFLTGT